MTGAEFTAALAAIGWTQRHLAILLRCDTNLPTRWARGAAIPEPVAAWLADLAQHHAAHPAPEWPRQRPGIRAEPT